MIELVSVILAAGEGKRMKSKKAKVLHEMCGKPLLRWVSDTVERAGISEQILVVGSRSEQVIHQMGDSFFYAHQKEQLGTGHAVLEAKEFLENKEGTVLVVCGDTPLITVETLKNARLHHQKHKSTVTVLTANALNPTGYGRVLRDASGHVLRIVEEKDCDETTRQIQEINSGIYLFEIQPLLNGLKHLKNNNKQNEYYLTDMVEILSGEGYAVQSFKINDFDEIMGINDRVQLEQATRVMNQRILKKHMNNGVTIVDRFSTFIEEDVEIGMDTVLYPQTFLQGKTTIGENATIGPNVRLVDVDVRDGVEITQSFIKNSEVREDATVGPFAYIRPGSVIGEKVKIGDFVEVKNAKIGANTKISHLSYVGDAEVGEHVNIGCGVVFVNYDGNQKHQTTVGDHAFIGCNANLVSPVVVEEGAYIAAGTTVTEAVPSYALAIGRSRQMLKEDWAKRKLKKYL